MSKSGEIPYSWELIESQIREAILCQATLLSHFGPWIDNEDKVTRAYLGIETGELNYQDMSKEEIAAGGTDDGSSWITKILAGKLVTFDLTKASSLAAYLRVSGPELAGELAWHLARMSEREAQENDEPKSSGPN